MPDIEVVTAGAIDAALSTNRRQYLCGDLKLPQTLDFLFDRDIEVGMTRYDEYSWEKPHLHPEVTEYQLMLEGESKYMDLHTGRVTHVKAGDFFIIRPNTAYLQKALPGTRILFFKSPGRNDKTPVPMTAEMERFVSEWE